MFYLKHAYGYEKNMFPWQLTLFLSPHTWFQNVSDFQLKTHEIRPWIQVNILFYMLALSCVWGTIINDQNRMPKMARRAFNIEEAWNPVCCHGNKTVKLLLWSTFSRILLQRIEHYWYKLPEVLLFIFDQNLVE